MSFGSRGFVVDFGELTFRTKDPNAYESKLGAVQCFFEIVYEAVLG
jgi:hypothetical protein